MLFLGIFLILVTVGAESGLQEDQSIGILTKNSEEIKEKYGREAKIECQAFGNPAPVVEWWLFRPATYLGRFDSATGRSYYENVSDATRARLDYTDWYSRNLFQSVFWGALGFSIVVCALTFLLNITWILTKKSILWWIQRAERLSRVRKMVEAMEKYRVRQLENLHDKYTRKVQVVRDNYHQQVDQLRMSYALQSERFRDYRAAQMETVTSHLENIRENYQQQLNRVREYGSRRAEQLWESYERQVNRMKAFSLQHRMNLMRQYKVKQRHLNKLLETFHDNHSPEALRKHEEEVRAALELPEVPVDDEPGRRLSAASSFYSLPEYVLDDSGTMRASPLVPTVRFTARELKSQSSQYTEVSRENE